MSAGIGDKAAALARALARMQTEISDDAGAGVLAALDAIMLHEDEAPAPAPVVDPPAEPAGELGEGGAP
jgi:hypothetical protein